MTELEEKIQRAVDKVMESKKTELEPQHIIKDGDYIWYNGNKYQKVETPQSFYDKLWEVVSKKVGDNTEAYELTDRVMDLIRENIPEPKVCDDEDYDAGYNDCVKMINDNLK